MASNTGNLQSILPPLARRINLAVWLTRSTGLAAGVIAVFAVLLLLLKMLAPQFSWWATVAFAGLPVVLVFAYNACRQSGMFFEPSEVAEVVDHLTGSDGLVTSVYERPRLAGDANFYDEIQRRLAAHLPRLDSAFFAKRLLPAVVFAAAVVCVPPRPPAPEKQKQEMMAAVTQPLAEQLQMTAEVLPEEEKEELQKQLEEVQKNPEGVSKEQWEAVEEMEQRIENAVAQSETAAGAMATAMNQLSGMMGEQKGDSTPLGDDAEKKMQMEKIIQDLTLKADNPKSPLTKAQRREMKDCMSKCKNGKCSAKDLDKLRKELAGLCDKLGNCKGGKNAGRGGVDRGRADAMLVLGEEALVEDAVFEEKELANQFIAPEDMVDMGIIPIQPKPEPGKFSPGTVKDFGSQEGSNVNRTRISPSQKDVVSKYFAK